MHHPLIALAFAGGVAAFPLPSRPATGPSHLATPRVVTIVAREYSFDAPASIPAGLTTFRLVDRGRSIHQAQLVRLEQGKTAADFAEAMKHPGPLPAWAVMDGGPNAPRPGGVSTETQMMRAGNYVITCFVPDPDMIPHVMKGMIRPLKVTAAQRASAVRPVSDVVVSMRDYVFHVSRPLRAGRHVIRVNNSGPQPHELEIIRLAPGKSASDFGAWAEKMAGPPPGAPMGGVAAMNAGGHGYATVDLPAGQYGLLCFVPDSRDGKPHVAHGMVTQITVAP